MPSHKDQKLTRYLQRTVDHIHRVQKNMLFLAAECAEILGLSRDDIRQAMYSVMRHDRSKFSEEQFEAYIELTEWFYQRKTLGNKDYQYPPGVEKKTDAAWEHHYKTENHHPERLNGGCNQMTRLECLEVICDLQAMAQEFNEGSCRKFFEGVWLPKHRAYFQWDDSRYWVDLGLMKKAIECFEMKMAGTVA